MSGNWLRAYLDDAVQRKLCTQIYCTTCGALDFRRGVLDALSRAAGKPARQQFERESAIEIAKALAAVTAAPDQALALEPVVRCLLFDLWSGVPLFDNETESLLDGTWAGGVLTRMKEHHRARVAARRAHEEFQHGAQGRRDGKRRLRQGRHQTRLALKQERDRLWREKQAKAD